MTESIPKLNLGKAYAGPEWYGCMNTGKRTILLNSRTVRDIAASIGISPKKAFYVVGIEQDVLDASELFRLVNPVREKLRAGRLVARSKYREVYIYRSQKTAEKMFHKLNAGVLSYNDRERRRQSNYEHAVATGNIVDAHRYSPR